MDVPLRGVRGPRRDHRPFGLTTDLIAAADAGEIPVAWSTRGSPPPDWMVLHPYPAEDEQAGRDGVLDRVLALDTLYVNAMLLVLTFVLRRLLYSVAVLVTPTGLRGY